MSKSIFKMKNSKIVFLSICVLVIILLAAGIQFFFNPLGLGPEPKTVLPAHFFTSPARDIGELELLVDGEEAFDQILAAIDSATESIYVQTYIWKDDITGKQVVTRLKSAARNGVEVTVSKDILGTVFELGDVLKGNPSPVFTKEGLKEYENINVKLDVFADTDHSKYFIVDELRYVPFSKAGAELLFEIISRAYEHHSLMVTSNLPFEEWTEVFGSERLTGALLDRLTHRCHILEANGESYRLRQAKKRSRRRSPSKQNSNQKQP